MAEDQKQENHGEEVATVPAAKKEFIQYEVKYVFSEKEKTDLANEMAIEQGEAERLELARSLSNSSYATQIKSHKLNSSRCARLIRDGSEMREVKCEVVRDIDAGTVSYIRADTGEVVLTRAMYPNEKQLLLAEAKRLEKKKEEEEAASDKAGDTNGKESENKTDPAGKTATQKKAEEQIKEDAGKKMADKAAENKKAATAGKKTTPAPKKEPAKKKTTPNF